MRLEDRLEEASVQKKTGARAVRERREGGQGRRRSGECIFLSLLISPTMRRLAPAPPSRRAACLSAGRPAPAGRVAPRRLGASAAPPAPTHASEPDADALAVALLPTTAPAVPAARALLGRLAAGARPRATRPPSPAVAALADAVARHQAAAASASPSTTPATASSLADAASLLDALAVLGVPATLSTAALAASAGVQARHALAEEAEGRGGGGGGGSGPTHLATVAAAAAAARASGDLGHPAGGVWLDAVLEGLARASGSGAVGPALAGGWADALDACLAARHAPGCAPAAAAAAARCSPSQAARIGCALALLGYDGRGGRGGDGGGDEGTPPLAAALRARVLGAPRGGVAPASAAAAAVALGAWGCLDPATGAAALDRHLSGSGGGAWREGQHHHLVLPLWAALRRAAGEEAVPAASPRAARAWADLAAAAGAAAAAEAAIGPPPEAARLVAWATTAGTGTASVVLTPPDGASALLWAVEVRAPGNSRPRLLLEVAPAGDVSTNAPAVRLGRGAALARRPQAPTPHPPRHVLVGRHEVGDAAALARLVGRGV